MLKSLVILTTFFSCSAFADSFASRMQTWKGDRKNFSVILDGASILLKGAGVKATYAVSDKLAIGGIFKTYELDSSSNDGSLSTELGYEYSHKVNVFGVIVDFYPTAGAYQSGIYLSGAVTSASVKTDVETNFFGQEKNSASDSKTGAQATVGYQFGGRLSNSMNILFQLGLGYGNAGAIKWRISGNQTELQNGLLLDLNGGLQF